MGWDEFDYEIRLELNSTGFTGDEAQQLLPDFITDHRTVIGLTWHPSVDGPESFNVILFIGIGAGMVAAGFLNALGQDLYRWVKDRVAPLMKAKDQAHPLIIIEFRDKKVTATFEDLDGFEEFWRDFDEIMRIVRDRSSSEDCGFVYDKRSGKWKLDELSL